MRSLRSEPTTLTLYRNLWAKRLMHVLRSPLLAEMNGRLSPLLYNHMHSSLYKCADFPFTNAPLLLVSLSLLFVPSFLFSSCAFSLPSEHNHLNNVTLPPLSPGMTLSQPHNNLGFNKYASLKTMGKTHAQTAVTSCNACHKHHTCSSRSLYPQHTDYHCKSYPVSLTAGKTHNVITYANITSQIKREKTLTCY